MFLFEFKYILILFVFLLKKIEKVKIVEVLFVKFMNKNLFIKVLRKFKFIFLFCI